MKAITLILPILFLFANFASAEVILRDGLITPEGIKTGVKITCENENIENSLKRWFEDYSLMVDRAGNINELKVTHTTYKSGLVNIRLTGHTDKLNYALQPAAGCGVNSFATTSIL